MAVRKVCEAVGTRSALLAAAGTAALIIKMSRQMEETTVAIDGSLFEVYCTNEELIEFYLTPPHSPKHYPRYADRMKNGIEEILGIFAENIHLEQASDGSGAGAALIAACAE